MTVPSLACAFAWTLAACGEAPSGPELAVEVAPLQLAAVGFACFDLQVDNADAVVWSRGNPALTRFGDDQTGGTTDGEPDGDTVCSDDFGNGARGDITYIGTCDARSDSDGDLANGVQNRVTIWIDAIADAAGTGDVGGWTDPCPDGCSLSVDCNANLDSSASFDLTIMRRAEQGFFDIAVNFDDIFCSAKVDTCHLEESGDETPIRLLFGADAERDWTAVTGLACTAGAGANDATELLYGAVAVTCGAVRFPLDLTGLEGNAEVTVGSRTLHYGIYRGSEQLECDTSSCNKRFWNFAVSLDDLAAFGLGECRLTFQATATRAGQFVAGLPSGAGLAWPYVAADLALTDVDSAAGCQRHALGGDDNALATHYAGTLAGMPTPPVMCSRFGGATPTATGGAGCTADAPDDPPDVPDGPPCPIVAESVITDGVLAAVSDARFTHFDLFPFENLQCITSIGGNLYFVQPFTASSVAMPNLVSVGGSVAVLSANGLVSLSLPKLATIGNELLVVDNGKLATLDLPRLTQVTNVGITNNAQLTQISLGSLVGNGNLQIQITRNPELTTLAVPLLTSVLRLSAEQNPKLSTCTLRELLTRLGSAQRFVLRGNLADCGDYDSSSPCPNGFTTLPSLLIDATHPAPADLACVAAIDGAFEVTNSDLQTLELPSLTRVGSLSIVANDNLSMLSLPLLAEADSVLVEDNPALSTCALRDLIAQLAGSPATLVLRDNAPDCVDHDSTAACPDGPETVANLLITPAWPAPANLYCIAVVTGAVQIIESAPEILSLPLLTHTGSLTVYANPALTTLSLPGLVSVDALYIDQNSALTSVDLGALVGNASLYLDVMSNPSLDSLDLDSLAQIGTFHIESNAALSTCDLHSIAERLDDGQAYIAIRDNLADCAYPCLAGTWFSTLANACVACTPIADCAAGHLECTDADASACTLCDPGFAPDDTGTACTSCAPDTFGDGSECRTCAPIDHCEEGALRCTGPGDATCSDCVVGYHVEAGVCADGDCPAGAFLNGDVCQACTPIAHCAPASLSCTDPKSSSCTSCDEGFELFGSVCVPVAECGLFGLTCPEGFACRASDAIGTSYSAFCVSESYAEVWVPAGSFWMGCNATLDANCSSGETPHTLVTHAAYAIDRTEVSAAEYAECVTAGMCSEPGAGSTYFAPEMAEHPINLVDWSQAAAYCAWSGKPAGPQRLCSESEWEHAARGGCETLSGDCASAMRVYSWGSTLPGPNCDLANWGYCPHPTPGPTSIVGAIPGGASPYGARDMAGNVNEWVADSPAGFPELRRLRGGGYNATAAGMRASVRFGGQPTYRFDYLGIRCCRSLP